MTENRKSDLIHDLLLPTLLFAALGGMSWAVRGSSGYGGSSGCIFAGVLWGAAWWFIARDSSPVQTRRYASAWIIFALTVGIGFSGNRGWMQWSSFFEGRLQTNYSKGEFLPISPAYGFLWLFIAGVPWAGLGACLLAWCGPKQPFRAWHWVARIAAGVCGVILARFLFNQLPDLFLPLHSSIADRYQDLETNPNLRRLINDNRNAITHLGLYLGFLGFELARRDWKNVLLIVTVGGLNGIGWAACQNWKWAPGVWPGVNFNWWRCWESSGGISIGIAYGVAFYLVNRRMSPEEAANQAPAFVNTRPNLERFGAYLGLVYGLGLSIQNGLKGWANIYLGNEDYWERQFWFVIGPLMLLAIAALAIRVWKTPHPSGHAGDPLPHSFFLVWLVLIVQNILAQLVTGPLSNRNELVFNIYYLVLFIITGAIITHYHFRKAADPYHAGGDSA
ncbi:MAG: hypothetical protein HUU16_20260 [Candidatus Omnitrophica bacterium]|nr:hypothetical protein [bacterium]NUN98498.1 hypothetical protein [Candidatus Omnitrophota bacterium]